MSGRHVAEPPRLHGLPVVESRYVPPGQFVLVDGHVLVRSLAELRDGLARADEWYERNGRAYDELLLRTFGPELIRSTIEQTGPVGYRMAARLAEHDAEQRERERAERQRENLRLLLNARQVWRRPAADDLTELGAYITEKLGEGLANVAGAAAALVAAKPPLSPSDEETLAQLRRWADRLGDAHA